MGWLSVDQLSCHAGLAPRHSHSTLKFAACSAWLDIGWLGDDNVLARVVVSCTLTLVLGFLDGSFFVALIQIRYNIGVEILNFLFERR